MASFFSRVAGEAAAALSDAYGHVMHGDDAGSSARVVWVVHPTRVPIELGAATQENGAEGTSSPGRSSYLFTQKFDLGLTFLEINDRAYVKTVDPGSAAEKAGIQPQDCVQFACVVGGPRFEDLQIRHSASDIRRGRRRESGRGDDERKKLDSRATKFVLDCEKEGMRTGYEELRDLFAGCTLPPRGEGGANQNDATTPPRTPVHSSTNKSRTAADDDFTIGSNSLMMADSMGGMFEHTKKKPEGNVSSRRMPTPNRKIAKSVTLNVTNAARNAAGRCFDPNAAEDDGQGSAYGEDGHRAKSGRAPELDTPASPIKSGNVISKEEQSLYPVVMVFRRTVQRKSLTTGVGGLSSWGSPGLSLRGSLFGIPSFRMDDECDRAAALIRQLAPSGSGSPPSPEATDKGGDENIEASTIRGMLNNAVGIGFVRLSKVVVGVSLQGGSGILVSRLPDGTWSAPSAMGVYGLGVGLQFGLEVADFLFIIQTKEGLDHFKRGGNFVVGGNIGAAVVNCGREAYGAASLGACTGRLPLDDQIRTEDEDVKTHDGTEVGSTFDESTYQSAASTLHTHKSKKKKDGNEIAPMVAYAMSRGLYFGVSVDGLKFFTRNDINARTYKFAMLSEMPAKDILSGLVAPPPEAEDLYAALHSIEYTHEMTELPRPPGMLRRDSMNDWRYDRSIAASNGDIVDTDDRKSRKKNFPPYAFLSTLNREEADEFALFETKFKKFLYGGVSVQYLMPHSAPTRSGMTRREKRTLWLMLPEVGSLRLGFVSKVKDGAGGDAGSTFDDLTVESSVVSFRTDVDDNTTLPPDPGNVKLSNKHSVSLTDVTTLSQDPNVTVRLSPDDATEHLRVLSIRDGTGKSLLFLANSNGEAELLFCGLKLLLESETSRLGVRGGVPLNELGGKLGKGALSPQTARGSLTSPRGSGRRSDRSDLGKNKRHTSMRTKDDLDDRSKYSSFGEPGTSSDESEDEDDEDSSFKEAAEKTKFSDRNQVPEGRQSWSQLPGRSAMRQMASGVVSPRAVPQAPPTYELGKVVYTDIATNVSFSLPLALCRVLFLDSSSPVNKAWESGRSDSNYKHDAWAFPPGSLRDFEAQSSSEQQLVSNGSMAGAQRTVSYSRNRNRELVRLSETIRVEKDDDQTLEFVIADNMPRRGFSAKARLFLRSFGAQSCEARVVAEITPVGKNLTNQMAVHKAFVLVLDEMKKRYGAEEKGKNEKGLLAVFLDVYNTLPGYGGGMPNSASPGNSARQSITSFKDVLTGSKRGAPRPLPGKRSPNGTSNGVLPSPGQLTPKRQQLLQERPSTPSLRTIDRKTIGGLPEKASTPQIKEVDTGDFADFSNFDDVPRNPVTVEVKPLPKIRLDLCPVPREEDEEENSVSAADAKKKSKSKSKHTKHKQKSRRSSRNRA